MRFKIAVPSQQGSTLSFIRLVRREAISRRDLEEKHKPLWGTSEEGWHHRRTHDRVRPRPFCESIILNCPKTFAEIRRRAVAHIASEGEVYEKRTSVAPARPRAQTRAQPARVHEAATGRKSQYREHSVLSCECQFSLQHLIGQTGAESLRAVSSTCHMKMKLPDLSGKVIVIKSDQEEARMHPIGRRQQKRITKASLGQRACGIGDPNQ